MTKAFAGPALALATLTMTASTGCGGPAKPPQTTWPREAPMDASPGDGSPSDEMGTRAAGDASPAAPATFDGGSDLAAIAVAPASPLGTDALTPAVSSGSCNAQSAQDFLVRGRFLREPGGNEKAIQYRTEQYGYFKGYGRPPADAQPPSAQVVATTFMGLPVRMHRKVVPALACVEREIEQSCADHPYTPHALAGIRFRNTYRGGEVTNHAYGIAIDIDPAINTCCGCVKPWSDAPACKRAGKSEYDHMAMPECWVHAFERFGFYWLGHDVLRDTMHFEFLGDPDAIVRGSAPTSGR